MSLIMWDRPWSPMSHISIDSAGFAFALSESASAKDLHLHFQSLAFTQLV